MQPIIIAMSGRKEAGKSTLGSFILSWYRDENQCMECSFADTLKEFCIETLGLEHCQCYGTDEEKNTSTKYKWEDVPDFLRWKFGNDPKAQELVRSGATTNEILIEFYKDPNSPKDLKTGFMTGREIMQVVGTDLVRETFGNVWAEATIRRIKRLGKKFAVITDNRFPNEIKTILKEPGGFVIRLTRSPHGMKEVHRSESALDDFNWHRDKCYVLDNAELDIMQRDAAVVPILKDILKKMESH